MKTPTAIASITCIAILLLAGCAGNDTGNSIENRNLGTAAGSTPSSSGQSAPTSQPSSPGPYPTPNHAVTLLASGATFPRPLIEAWTVAYAQDTPVQVSYGGGGSGKGIKDITNKDVFFGCSDAPLQPSEKAAAPGILQYPETMGVIGVVYNVDALPNGIHLDGETIGKIFTGAIRNWNQIPSALNPGVALPNAGIAIVYRSDSSGTTFAYTDFLAKASPTWAQVMGNAPTKAPVWGRSSATQLSGSGNEGVGSTVKTTPFSIGYVELSFVRSLGLKAAAIQTADGTEYLSPSNDGGAKAAQTVSGSLPSPDGDWSTVSIAYKHGAGVYPISTLTYTLVYQNLSTYGSQGSGDKFDAFRSFAWWTLHDGQQYSDPLGYAPLPPEIVAVGEHALSMMSKS
jgi:phosphate transport system substrate-binding protein